MSHLHSQCSVWQFCAFFVFWYMYLSPSLMSQVIFFYKHLVWRLLWVNVRVYISLVNNSVISSQSISSYISFDNFRIKIQKDYCVIKQTFFKTDSSIVRRIITKCLYFKNIKWHSYTPILQRLIRKHLKQYLVSHS